MLEAETEDAMAAVLNLISLSSNLGCMCCIRKLVLVGPPNDLLAADGLAIPEDDEAMGGMMRDVAFPPCSSPPNSHLAFSIRH